jgi:hypothetical protein
MHFCDAHEPIVSVEQEHTQVLLIEGAHLVLHQGRGLCRGGDRRPVLRGQAGNPPPQLDGREECAGLGDTDARQLAQFGRHRPLKCSDASDALEHIVCHLHSTTAACAHTQQDGEQFGVS